MDYDARKFEFVRERTFDCGTFLMDAIVCRYKGMIEDGDDLWADELEDLTWNMVNAFVKCGLCLDLTSDLIYPVASIIGVEVDERDSILQNSELHVVNFEFIKEYGFNRTGKIVVIPDSDHPVRLDQLLEQEDIRQMLSNSTREVREDPIFAYVLYLVRILLLIITTDKQLDGKEMEECDIPIYLMMVSIFLSTAFRMLFRNRMVVSSDGKTFQLTADVYATLIPRNPIMTFDINIRNVKLKPLLNN